MTLYLNAVETVQVAGRYHDLRDFLSDPDELDNLTTYLAAHGQAPEDATSDLDEWLDAATDDARSIIRGSTGDTDAEVYPLRVGEAILYDLADSARGRALADLAEAVQQIAGGVDPLPDRDEPMTEDSEPGAWSGLVVWNMSTSAPDYELACRWIVDRDEVPTEARSAWRKAGYAGDGIYGTVGDVGLEDLTLTDAQRQAVDQWTVRKFGARS